MHNAKQWIALTVVGVLAVLAAGWFLLVSPKRAEAADVRDQTTQQQATLSGLNQQLSMLKAQAKALPAQQAKLMAVAAKIPDNPALPALVRALTRAADEAGVELLTVAPSAPLAVAPAAATTAVTPTAGAAGTTPKATKPVGTTGAAAAPAAGTAGTLQSIAVQLTVAGGYFQIAQFVDRLEGLTRAFKVGTLTMAPGTDPTKPAGASQAASQAGRLLNGVIGGTVYMATGRTTVAAPAVPAK